MDRAFKYLLVSTSGKNINIVIYTIMYIAPVLKFLPKCGQLFGKIPDYFIVLLVRLPDSAYWVLLNENANFKKFKCKCLPSKR